jgi:hypothetical protein
MSIERGCQQLLEIGGAKVAEEKLQMFDLPLYCSCLACTLPYKTAY